MYSGAIAATIGRHERGVATVTSPAPDRSAPMRREVRRAGLARASRRRPARGRSRPCASRRRAPARSRASARASAARAAALRARRAAARNADVGDHQIAGVRVGRRKDQRNLRRRQRDGHRRLDRLARRAPCVSADSPVGRSIATTGTPSALTSATTVSSSPVSGPRKPVPKIASTISVALGDLAEVQLPLLRVGDLDDRQADAAEDLEIDARVAAARRRRCRAGRPRLDAALHQRARDDEAVAAVVAAAAEHRRRGSSRGRRTPLPSPRRPGGRRSPSARSTECRCPRSCGDRPRASARC